MMRFKRCISPPALVRNSNMYALAHGHKGNFPPSRDVGPIEDTCNKMASKCDAIYGKMAEYLVNTSIDCIWRLVSAANHVICIRIYILCLIFCFNFTLM